MQTSDLFDEEQGAIMASLDPKASQGSEMPANEEISSSPQNQMHTKSLPDVLSTELQSLTLLADHDNNYLSFPILEEDDTLSVSDYDELCRKLGCDPKVSAKVVSIVGNSGEGKSFALNHIFFPHEGEKSETVDEVFPTSSAADGRCTHGVWAAFEPRTQTLVLDTEGMLGVTNSGSAMSHENRRSRQLLKVMALSDVVIFKSRAERIQTDLLYFLGDASKAYNNHFNQELEKLSDSTSLGPTVIIFHETRFTKCLQAANDPTGRSAEMIIRDQLTNLNQVSLSRKGHHHLK